MRKDVFAERFKIALNQKGISAAELSKLSGVSEGVISQYKSGKYQPKRDRINMFCEILGVSPAWLTGYDERKFFNIVSFTYDVVGQRLVYLRNCNKMSIEEAAEALNVKKSVIIRWESDEKSVSNSDLEALSDLYHTSISYILGATSDPSINSDKLHRREDDDGKPADQFAIVKTIKKCVEWFYFDDISGYISVSVDDPKSYFFYQIQDQSMHPSIPMGSLAFIHRQKDFDNGDLILALYNDQCLVRKIFIKGETRILQPLNLVDYDPIIITGEDLRELSIVGKITHSLSRIDW